MLPNKFGGSCEECGEKVAVREGGVYKAKGTWHLMCQICKKKREKEMEEEWQNRKSLEWWEK